MKVIRDLDRIEATSILVMGSNGHVYVLQRRRGSLRLSIADLSKIADDHAWRLEMVSDTFTEIATSLNEAYEKYLSFKSQELELSAEKWLIVADKLAGRLSDLIEINRQCPKIVTVYLEKPKPLFPPKEKIQKPRKKKIDLQTFRQLSFFGG